jgi:energy-coupling factor transporter ATP-binding protein EcfA2
MGILSSMHLSLLKLGEDFTGREWALQSIDSWLAGNGRLYVIGGGPGSGKTALAARLALISSDPPSYGGHKHLRKDSLTYFHFCQATNDPTVNPLDFIRRLSLALGERYPEYALAINELNDPNINIQANVNVQTMEAGASTQVVVIKDLHIGSLSSRLAFNQLVRRPLEQICTPNFEGQIVILVDALDEAIAYNPEDNIANLLGEFTDHPDDLPRPVRFILTGRFEDPRLKELFGKPNLDLIKDAPPGVNDLYDYARKRLKEIPEPTKSELARKISDASAGNFLYAFHILNDINTSEDLPEDPADLELPQGLFEVYRQFIRRELGKNKEKWSSRYRPSLGLLAVGRGAGLNRPQLTGILGQAKKLDEDDVDIIINTCAQYLSGLFPDGPFRLHHRSFYEFLFEDPTYAVSPALAHRQIADFFLATYQDDWFSCLDDYVFRYLEDHLKAGGRLLSAPEQKLARIQVEEKLTALKHDQVFRWASASRLVSDRVPRAVNAWLAVDEPGCFLITGGPGCGKTTLAKRLEQISIGEATIDPYEFPRIKKGWLAYTHYCSVTDLASLSPRSFLESWLQVLSMRFPEFILPPSGEDTDRLSIRLDQEVKESEGKISGVNIENLVLSDRPVSELIERWLLPPFRRIVDSGYDEPHVLLVDGLEKSLAFSSQENLPKVLFDLARYIPNIRILITSRPDQQIFWLFGQPALRLEDYEQENMDLVGASSYQRLNWLPEPDRIETSEWLAENSQGNHLYASLILDEIARGRLDKAQIQEMMVPKNLETIYENDLLNKVARKEDWEAFIGPVFGLLAVARPPGLTLEHLSGITGETREEVRRILKPVEQYVTGNIADGPYQLYHQSFRDFLLAGRSKRFGVDGRRANLQIGEYFQQIYTGNWESADDYAICHAADHLIAALNSIEDKHKWQKGWQRTAALLEKLLSEPTYREEKVRRFSQQALQDDLEATQWILNPS